LKSLFDLVESLVVFQVQACELSLLACRLPKQRSSTATAVTISPQISPQISQEVPEAPEVEKDRKSKVELADKDIVFEESSMFSRFVGIILVVVLAGGLIVIMLRS
jgi:hypothetical protein